MNKEIELNPNPVVQFLQKPAKNFTKSDIIKYVVENDIEMINFRYPGEDGRLKTLSFVINSIEYLDSILTSGERVDGSSLFSYIEAGSSDLYVIPRYRTAFLNPFSEIPALDILCSFYDKDGEPLKNSPEYILKKAHKTLKEKTGYSFEAMAELEFYVIGEYEDFFEPENQKGYHESEPFTKYDDFRKEAMIAIAQSGGHIKYAHSEVGNFILNDKLYEQNEIEFLPIDVETAADEIVIAKWILRTLAYEYGLSLTFAPKITVGKAGSGMHIHTKLVKDGKNAYVENNKLSDAAKKVIAGILDLSPSLTAFGNRIPTSYFRLVPHQEAPTNICWGDRNRSVLVRVPLGWTSSKNMAKDANPLEDEPYKNYSEKQTVEFRCPDGSADIYLLLAGLVVAARHGLQMENALDYAEKKYVGVNIFDDKNKDIIDNLNQLPTSCVESAESLLNQSDIYKKYDVFSQNLLVGLYNNLKSFNDKTLRKDIENNEDEILKIVNKYFHCG